MRKLVRSLFFFCMIGILLLQSCSDETDRPVFPLSATIFHSVDEKQVAFTALTHSATTWSWDFGDGQTSTEQDPVHIYEEGGYYVAKLTASDDAGNTVTSEVNLAVALTPYALLTGDHTQPDYDGKVWKLTTAHGTDYFANADASLSTADGTPNPLPNGVFSQLSMPEAYNDEFTFYYDGTFKHDTKDGNSFGGIVYQFVLDGGASITNADGSDYGLCVAKYTPDANATFTYSENEDLVVASVYGANGTVTYDNVSTLNFSGTEFIGFRDYQKKVIIKQITDSRMQLIIFMAAAPDYFPANTHALVLSFEVVK